MADSKSPSPPAGTPPTLMVHPPQHGDWLDKDEVAGLTAGAITQRVLALTPLIAANAAEAERQRRPVTDVWRAILRTGLLYHYVPRRFGGLELGMEAFLDH